MNQLYLHVNNSVRVWVKCENFGLADVWIQCKLHLDLGMDGADVLVEFESIQFESNVDVGTNTSI